VRFAGIWSNQNSNARVQPDRCLHLHLPWQIRLPMHRQARHQRLVSAAAAPSQRLKLQTSYGQAMMWSKGYAAPETKIAFTRARELSADAEHAAERFPTYYGLWVGSLVGGELASARATASLFLCDADSAAWPSEAGAARRALGQTCLWQGDFNEAQTQFEEALRIYNPKRDRDVKFRFGMDTGAGSRALLAVVNWLLGAPARVRELIDGALALAVEFGHVPTLAPIYFHKAQLEMLRGDAGLALRFGNTLIDLSRDHGMPLFLALATSCRGWAGAQLGEREAGIAELRGGLTAFMEQGNKLYVPFLQGLLAELEAEGQDQGAALTGIEEALALANRTGEHWTDSFLHRIRGEILLKRDPADTAPAEEAFLTAIAVATAARCATSLSLSAISMASPRCAIASWKAERRSAWSPALPHHSIAASVRPAWGEMMRQHFGLSCRLVGEAVAQSFGGAAMQDLAPAFQQVLVGCVLNERMLEAVVAFRHHAFHQHDVGVRKPFKRRFQRRIVHAGDGL
jgi:predicted ATPase